MTDGNDDAWYPAFGTSMAAGNALEEEKKQSTLPKKAEAFTDKPASSNMALMDFEAQLLLKAGKQPPPKVIQEPQAPQQTSMINTVGAVQSSQIPTDQLQEDQQPRAKPRFKVGIPKT